MERSIFKSITLYCGFSKGYTMWRTESTTANVILPSKATENWASISVSLGFRLTPIDCCTRITRLTLLLIPRLLNWANFDCPLVVQFSAFQEATTEGTRLSKGLDGIFLFLFIESCSTSHLRTTESLGLRSFQFLSCCKRSSTDMDGLMLFLEDLASARAIMCVFCDAAVHVERHRFYFDISAMEKGEQMLKAEFRVFKLKRTHVSSRSDVTHFCRVEVYELLESGSKPQKTHLIASRLLSLYTEGWEVFNVTQTVSKWIANSSSNHGFLITTTHVFNNRIEHNLVKFAKSQGTLQESRNALLVLFTNSNKRRSSSFVPFSTKPEVNPASNDASHVPHETQIIKSSDVSMSRRPRAAADPSAKSRVTACHRRELYVDFRAIGWSGWIIYPSGYNAFYCRGSCLFPLGESLNATNHATVQSIVHTLKLAQDVSTPCCVPDELKSLNLLYFDEKENVVLKNYKDMVATSCGCH